MPKYLYKCVNCKDTFFYYHLISESKTECEECKGGETLVRLPTTFSINKDNDAEVKVGHVVKQSIEEFQSDLKEEKNRLKNHMWSSDD